MFSYKKKRSLFKSGQTCNINEAQRVSDALWTSRKLVHDGLKGVSELIMHTIEFFLTKIVLSSPMTNLTHTRPVSVRDASDSTHVTHPESIKPAPDHLAGSLCLVSEAP